MEEDDVTESNSINSDNIDDLDQNVQDLNFEENIPPRPQAVELIQKLIQDFTEFKTNFLVEYLGVLQNSSPSAVTDVTNDIVFSIEAVLEQGLSSNQKWQEPVLIVLLGWMCVTVLCLVDPQMQSPHRVLNELLLYTTIKERVKLARVFWRHLGPAQLIELSDLTTQPKDLDGGPSEPEVTLSELLLRAALCSLQPNRQEPQWLSGALHVEEAEAAITSAWAMADATRRALLVQAAARTHAERAIFALAQDEMKQVSIEITKLSLLSQKHEEDKEVTKKSNKRKKE